MAGECCRDRLALQRIAANNGDRTAFSDLLRRTDESGDLVAPLLGQVHNLGSGPSIRTDQEKPHIYRTG